VSRSFLRSNLPNIVFPPLQDRVAPKYRVLFYEDAFYNVIDTSLANGKLEPPKPLRVLPFGRNKEFVGRQSQLDRLITILHTEDTTEDCQRAALVGLGGVGKTQIALEIAFQIQKLSPEYSLFWVRASDRTSFETAYRQIGQQLKIPGLDDDKADVKELVRAALSLERSGKWIMIVDNADDFELLYTRADASTESRALHEYLPCSPLGAILFTTRDREAATKYAGPNVIVIEEMDDGESRVLLKTSLQNKRLVEDEDGTTKLLKLLVNLPLAIMQAAAYLNAKGATIAEYLRIYEESSDSVIKLLSKDFEDRRRYPGLKNPVATTWLISFEQIRLRDPLAADYMAFISCINDQDIPGDLLPPAPRLQKAEAIGTLKAFGFIKKRLRGESYDMHRLVHIAMQSWLSLNDELKSWNEKRPPAQKETEKYRALALKSVADAFTVDEEDDEHLELYQQLLPHAKTILAHEFVGSTDQKCKAKLLHNAAWYVSEQGDFRSAEKWMIEAVEIRTDEMGKGDSETLKSMQQLSIAYSDMGKAKEAAELQKRVVRTISEKNNGEEDSDSLDAMALLATMYSNLGMWSEAEELGQRVVKVSEELDADETDIANQKRSLALIYKNSGKLKLAAKLAEEVFEQLGETLGPEDPETLSCMHTLAMIYEAQGKLDKATNLGMQVMETYRRTLGDSHPITLTIMGDMALIYDRQGKLEEAQRLGELIVVAFEKTLGKDHPETLTSLSNLLSVYRRLGKLEEAEKRGELVIEVSKRVLGEKHRYTLLKMGDLASTYRDRGKLDEAAELGLLVLSMRKSTLEESHPDILLGITNLASTYREQGRLTEAEELEKSAEDLRQKQGEDHPRVLASKNNLASIYRKQGRLQEAEELGSQVLKQRMEVLGDNHPETLVTRTDLALTYHKQGRYLKMQETLLGSGHLDTPNSTNDFAGTHESVGQSEEREEIPEAGDKGVEGEVARARETLVAQKKVSSERRALVETRGLVWYLALPGFAIAFLFFVMIVASRVWRM
jgi:tetratricopeptide (TPR) repeat protein